MASEEPIVRVLASIQGMIIIIFEKQTIMRRNDFIPQLVMKRLLAKINDGA